jgi:hypothetical protein
MPDISLTPDIPSLKSHAFSAAQVMAKNLPKYILQKDM